jgi:serine/threonine protein phosphatase PrpC
LTAIAGTRLGAAAAAAAAAVEEVTRAEHGDSPPSCTFVAAVLDGDRLAVGNVGDSRAYWLPDIGDPKVLTVDDSWAAQQVAGGVPRAEAEAGPQAHAITRWLGVDAEDQVPTVTHHRLDGSGWLLLCSDGLWNYASEATATARIVAPAAAAAAGDPLRTAEELVRWANEQGGMDNITVALARLGAQTHEGDPA